MKGFSLGRLGLIAVAMSAIGICAPALAGDFPAPTYSRAPVYIAPIYDWSGAYIGANGGWGSSRACWDFTTPGGNFVASEGCHNANGGTAGGQLGYRWQSNAIVFGIEGQGNWAGLKGSNNSNFFLGSTNQTSVNALGLLTGQIGYAWDNVLLYVKGGAAVTDNNYKFFNTVGGALAGSTGDQTRWAAWSAPVSNTVSRRTGRQRSNTIICSWERRRCRSRIQPARPSETTTFARMSIWSPFTSTTAGVARRSRSTDVRLS